MPARKRGGLTCPYLIQASCFVPDGHRARRPGGEPPEARGGSHLVVLSTAARGALLQRTTPRVPAGPGEARPRQASGLCAFRRRRGEHAEVQQQGTGRPSRWGLGQRSARAGIDRCVRQPRSRVHSGDRLCACTGREGGGQCVFRRRHRATHARGGYGAGPLPSIARFRRLTPRLPAPATTRSPSARVSSPRPAGTAVAFADAHPP